MSCINPVQLSVYSIQYSALMAKLPHDQKPNRNRRPLPEAKTKRRAVTKRLFRTTKKTPFPVRAREEPANRHLTAGEMETLRVFSKLYEEKGECPSVREVSKAMDLSEQGAQRHLIQLSLKGALEDVKELKVVGRRLTPLGRQWLKMPS